ncbi:NAD(P)H:quinone oxidoreductase [Streptomyces sp. MBT53]|nr:NAD(P)H:quinone oxidoreductase [Streptomyces sp. MBT53]
MSVSLPPAGTYVIDPARSSVTFTTRHLFGLGRVSGTFQVESGRVTIAEPVTHSTARAVIEARSFRTGTSRRDNHVRSPAFLHAERYPEIRFESTRVARGEEGAWVVKGLLTVRGHQAPVELTVDSLSVDNGSLRISASTSVDRYRHGLTASKGLAARRLRLTLTTIAHPEPSTAAPAAEATAATAVEHAAQREEIPMSPKIAVIYYSSTGTVHELAEAVAEGARKEGAEVRLLRVSELAPEEAIAANDAWSAHASATKDIPVATPADIEWADAVIFGSPTRFGNVASQLKQFIDTLGGLWAQGKLADKVYSGFTATATAHGGQESTLLALYNSVHHFGGIIVTPGYTDPVKFADGNPYGTSHVNGQGALPVDDTARAAAAYQGKRVATVTARFNNA